MANRVEPDQMSHYAASDLGLSCLPRHICANRVITVLRKCALSGAMNVNVQVSWVSGICVRKVFFSNYAVCKSLYEACLKGL